MTDDDKSSRKLALLAHDLRTPLSAMRLTAELIGAEALTDTQSERLDLLIRSIDALADLTGDLIQGGDRPTSERSLTGLVEETAELYRVAAERKGLALDLSLAPLELMLPAGRAGAVRRVVTALLDNAVKYTDAGKVTLAVAYGEAGPNKERQVVLSVEDTGPGIDPIERGRLFHPFVRGAAGKARSAGSGLGLWGAQQLVSDLGGDLQLATAPGGGCRFEVVLPVEALRKGTGGGVEAPDIENPEAHVLAVDDNLTNRRLLAALLESFGISCELASSGPEAVELAATGRFDAVLLDLHMPEMDGMETAERIRALGGAQGEIGSVPLIAVTAAPETVDEDRLEAAGICQVLAKPLSPTGLFDAMEHARAFRRARTEAMAGP